MSELATPRRRFGFGFWSFIAFMLALMALFIGLGLWQVERLGEKERLIASVDARTHFTPVPLPPATDWPSIDPDAIDYLPISVTGRYIPARTVLVFTSLDTPRGRYSGPGYWVLTPFAIAGGGTLFVNRGFIPQDSAPAYRSGADAPTGDITLSGLARRPEAIGTFTPGPDLKNKIEFVNDPARLAALDEGGAPLPTPIAPLTLDLPAAGPGVLPQGGETVVEFPNNHLGYIMTWFGFALLVPFLLAFWIRQQVRKKP